MIVRVRRNPGRTSKTYTAAGCAFIVLELLPHPDHGKRNQVTDREPANFEIVYSIPQPE